MQHIVEVRHPAREPATTQDRPGALEVARVVDDAGSIGGPLTSPYSFLAECECPDNCPRDHENE